MIGGWLGHLEKLPVVGGGPTTDPHGIVIRVDIPPLGCVQLCGPESLPFTGVTGDLLAWAAALLAGGAVLFISTVVARHPIGRTRR
ncbi:hypothetical protein [Agromyces sp. PvR057]|uniref:hypothetical protein n=1 Tax=Agromyces sp. PvR057 TaxID=3156403 RepID=UPI000E24917B